MGLFMNTVGVKLVANTRHDHAGGVVYWTSERLARLVFVII